MKKIMSVLAALCLFVSFAVPVSAAGFAVNLSSSKTSVSVGDTVTLTVSLSGAGKGTSGYIEVAAGEGFEILSGKFLTANTQRAQFDVSTSDGIVLYNGESDPNGPFCEIVLKAKKSSKVAQNVSVTVDIRNGSDLLGSIKANKDIKIVCSSHTYTAYTKVNDSTHKRTCTACGHEEISSHTWNAGTVTKQPTCKESGSKHFECTACKAVKDETLPETNNHNWGSYETKTNPTCTAQGLQTKKCKVCGIEEDQPIPAKGHSMGAWNKTKDPTCTQAGEEKRSCKEKGCGHTETRAINPLGHRFTNPTVTKQPTCTESGEESGKCTICGQTTTQSIKPLGHKFSNWSDLKAPTCTDGGIQERKCTVCGAAETRNTSALGHDFENPTVIKEPTISETGLKEGKCKRCGETASEVIPCSVKDEATGTLFEANEGTFEKGSEIRVEEIKEDNPAFESVKNILKEICKEFKLYDITAYLNGAKIQPNGEVTVTFEIPKGFGKNVAVYYITENGSYEKLESAVSEDGSTVKTKISHFSNYAVCKISEETDEVMKDETNNETEAKNGQSNKIWIIVLTAVILLAGAGTGAFFYIRKKKQLNRFFED